MSLACVCRCARARTLRVEIVIKYWWARSALLIPRSMDRVCSRARWRYRPSERAQYTQIACVRSRVWLHLARSYTILSNDRNQCRLKRWRTKPRFTVARNGTSARSKSPSFSPSVSFYFKRTRAICAARRIFGWRLGNDSKGISATNSYLNVYEISYNISFERLP